MAFRNDMVQYWALKCSKRNYEAICEKNRLMTDEFELLNKIFKIASVHLTVI